ncbi:hypothetical protein CPB97_005140, partial [Podila verticillata]
MDDDIFDDDAGNIYDNNAEFDPAEWDQVFELFERNLLDDELEGQLPYEADLAANRAEEIAIPERVEYFFGIDEIRAGIDDMRLEEAIEMENEDNAHEQDQGNFEEGERRVQVIVEGIELVRQAVEGIGNEVVPNLDNHQQLQDLLPLLQLLALAIQAMHGNFMQIQPRIERPHIPDIRFDLGQVPSPNCQLYFRFYEGEILQMVVALRIPEILILDNGSKVHCVEAL